MWLGWWSRPQHLKDLIQHVDVQCPLLVALAEFCSLVLRGDVPQEVPVRPFWSFSGCSEEEVWGCEANSCGLHPASPRGQDCKQTCS